MTEEHDTFNQSIPVMKWASSAQQYIFFLFMIHFPLYINSISDNQLVGYAYFHTIVFTLALCYSYFSVIVLEYNHTSLSIVLYFYNSSFLHITVHPCTTTTYLITQPTVYKADLYDSSTLASQLLSFDYTLLSSSEVHL